MRAQKCMTEMIRHPGLKEKRFSSKKRTHYICVLATVWVMDPEVRDALASVFGWSKCPDDLQYKGYCGKGHHKGQRKPSIQIGRRTSEGGILRTSNGERRRRT
ncbi:hypothetical protein J6590_039893 [Homalodisca vitripennis]|nr:hypothetical protein J6590_039893 [Homalodisca vitripennis]